MKKIVRMGWLTAALIGSLVLQSPAQRTPAEIVREMQKRLDKAALVKVEFRQVFHWTLTEETQEVAGTLYLGKKDEFRLETPEQLIISDGKTVWTFDQINQQVIIDRLDRSEDAFLPRQLLARYGDAYRIRVVGEEELDGRNCTHLHLVPKNRDRYIQELDVWIDDREWITRKVTYRDVNDNRTEYRIVQVAFLNRENPELFQARIPEGMEVVDMR